MRYSNMNILNKIKFESLGYKQAHYQAGLLEENGITMYYHRTPLYFRDCQSPGKGIYFSNFFAWMGKIRESAMFPILNQISDDFSDGDKGMITNSSSIKIVGNAISGDVIEARFGLAKIVNDSTLEIFFIWKKLLEDGSYQDIAYGEMSVSWVNILSYGVIRLEPLPNYYNEFIDKIKAADKKLPYVHQIVENEFKSFTKGEKYYIAPIVPRRGKQLHEEIIKTTLEDGNSVGNIYFSNYSRWQGLVRDAFFYKINNIYFENIGEEGELIVTDSSVSHLQETMPFSTIQVSMNIIEIWDNSIELSFAYYRIDNDHKIKLATGTQTVVWAKKDKNDHYLSSPFPKEYLEKLISYVS